MCSVSFDCNKKSWDERTDAVYALYAHKQMKPESIFSYEFQKQRNIPKESNNILKWLYKTKTQNKLYFK